MSHNISIMAVLGKERREFPVIQTPTPITRMIQASTDPVETYAEYVLSSVTEDEIEYSNHYDAQGRYVGVSATSWADRHVNHLRNWIAAHRADGFQIMIFST